MEKDLLNKQDIMLNRMRHKFLEIPAGKIIEHYFKEKDICLMFTCLVARIFKVD